MFDLIPRPFGRMACAASIAAVMALGTPAFAQEQAQAFDILAQPLSSALIEFSKEADLLVVVDPAILKGRSAPSVRGTFTPKEALELLIAESGLVASPNPEGGFVLAARVGVDATSAVSHQDIAEILVTGTRIRGVQDLSAPAMVVTRGEFQKTGATTVQEVFERLPQNLDEISADASFATGTSRVASSNTEFASGVSLRGLGPQSTLVLLNGTRRPGSIDGRVVDLNAIPLSAIERVEIVTGGRSSVYGSDAVAGVVNLITRRDFAGAETQAYFGAAQHGGERFQASQIVGGDFGDSGFVASIHYSKSRTLDAVNTGAVLDRPSVAGITTLKLPLQPETDRTSVFLSGHHRLTGRVEFYGDALYSHDRANTTNDQLLPPAGARQLQMPDQAGDQYSANVGALIDLGSSWQLDMSGVYGESNRTRDGRTSFDNRPFDVSRSTSDASLSSLSAVINGPLLAIRGRDIKAAFGTEIRAEDLSRQTTFQGVRSPAVDADRTVKSVFGELLIPVFGSDARASGNVELSLSARYDDYSDFGDTFNPQAGVVWRALPGLLLRGAYSTAFRAPDLFSLSFSDQQFLIAMPDPAAPPFFFSPVLISLGGNPDLGPETADTWSTGFEYSPPAAPWLRLNASYYDISYRHRIDQPADDAVIFFVLQNPANYGALIERDPTPEHVAGILGDGSGFVSLLGPIPPSAVPTIPGLVTFDNRFGNVGIETVRGVDANVATQFAMGNGTLSFGLNATYFLEYERRLSVGGPSLSQLNRPGKPVDFRLQGDIGVTQGPFGAFLQVSYINNYQDPFARPQPVGMDSWTTVDLTLRFESSKLVQGGVFDDLTVALSISNLFDAEPPFFGNNLSGLNFDAANANATGRFVSLRAVKVW